MPRDIPGKVFWEQKKKKNTHHCPQVRVPRDIFFTERLACGLVSFWADEQPRKTLVNYSEAVSVLWSERDDGLISRSLLEGLVPNSLGKCPVLGGYCVIGARCDTRESERRFVRVEVKESGPQHISINLVFVLGFRSSEFYPALKGSFNFVHRLTLTVFISTPEKLRSRYRN